MKIKFFAMLGCFLVLTGCAAYRNPDAGAPYPCERMSCFYCMPNCCYPSCACTDPACLTDTCCMDCTKCCAAFGNVGGGCFEPLGMPYMPPQVCGPRYIPRIAPPVVYAPPPYMQAPYSNTYRRYHYSMHRNHYSPKHYALNSRYVHRNHCRIIHRNCY